MPSGDNPRKLKARAACAVQGCGLPARCKGLCDTHDGRRRRNGDPHIGRTHHYRDAANWSRSKTYICWRNMRLRCTDPNNVSFERYGARGVTYCERWNEFENFLSDMGRQPPDMQLERIDNDGNYEPGNCRWATRVEQGRNKRNNRLITVGGETLTMSAWAERCGISTGLLHARLKLGWSEDVAVTTPKIPRLRRGVLRGQALRPAVSNTGGSA